MAVYDVAKQLIAISPDIPDETAQVLDQHKDPGRLGDIVAATVDLSPEERPRCWWRSTWPSASGASWSCSSARWS